MRSSGFASKEYKDDFKNTLTWASVCFTSAAASPSTHVMILYMGSRMNSTKERGESEVGGRCWNVREEALK